MIPKSGNRFSEKIMLKQRLERDADSTQSHPALAAIGRRGFQSLNDDDSGGCAGSRGFKRFIRYLTGGDLDVD
jgi:hypothetical protein